MGRKKPRVQQERKILQEWMAWWEIWSSSNHGSEEVDAGYHFLSLLAVITHPLPFACSAQVRCGELLSVVGKFQVGFCTNSREGI